MFDEDEIITEQEQRKNSSIIRDQIIEYFCELWTTDQLKGYIDSGNFARPYCVILLRYFANVKRVELTNQQKLANILYEVVGSKFLRNTTFLSLILITIEQNNPKKWNHILKQSQIYYKNNSIKTPEQITSQDRRSKWMSFLAKLLDLDESCAVVEEKPPSPKREDITPANRLPPLYDFQYALSREIKEMLEGKVDEKHAIIAIPTGGGKTRLMVETIVDWLNENGFEKNFIFWIAQSEELCEQAINTFKEVFYDKGRFEKLTIHRFFKDNNSLPSPYDNGVIVANISMIDAHVNELDEFASRTGLIVIDEVHRSTSKMYRKFYKIMGIDFRLNRAKSIPENEHKISLIGLSATPFRGNYSDSDDDEDLEERKETETEKLHRYYHDNIILPIIPDSELKNSNKIPHAIIEVEKEVYQNGWIRISGSRSYDEDGRITHYAWTFHNENNEKVDSRTGETISYRFDTPGTYKIGLIVNDDEQSEAYAKTHVTVLPAIKTKKLEIKENMKLIHGNLVTKQILSDVHQRVITLEVDNEIQFTNDDKISLKENKMDFPDFLLQKIGEHKLRNIKTIEEIQKLISEGRKSILFFAASVDHAQDMSIILNSMGIDSRYVIGEMESFDRFDAIKKFKSQDVTVLCNYGVLTQGFDAPLTDVVIIARPTMSHLLYNQMVGRGLRGVKNGGTEDCILVDFEDTILKRTMVEIGIEKDLVWVDFTSMWRTSQKTHEVISEYSLTTPEIAPLDYADFESQLNEKLIKCPHCKIVSASVYQEIKNKFGFAPSRISKSNPFGTQSWCKQCRTKQLKEIKTKKTTPFSQDTPKTFEELMTFANSEMKMQSNYQPLMMMGLLENGPMTKVEIAQLLAKENNSDNHSNYMNVPVYKVLTSKNIVVFDNEHYRYEINSKLEAKEKFDLIQIFKEKLNSFILSKTGSLKLKAINYYEKFIGENGYPPTSRMFNESDAPVGLDFFKENYESYENFQKQQGIDVFGNTELREKLFDQFFEGVISSKGTDYEIPSSEIDGYGEFTKADYHECFGSYESFMSVVSPILDKLEKIKPIEDEKLKRDYFDIRKKIGHIPNFDQVRLKSDKGIEYYIKGFGSYGKFKDKFTIEDEIIIADKQMKIEFHELKNKLNFTPTYEMFKNKFKINSKYWELLTQFYGSYSNFLKSMDEKEIEITPAIKNQKKQELKRRFKGLIQSSGEENALKSLQNDELLYKQWFSSITQFLKNEFPYLLSRYQYSITKEKSSGINESVSQSPDNLYTTPEIKTKKHTIIKKINKEIDSKKQKLTKNYKIYKTEKDRDDYTPPELRTVYPVPKKSLKESSDQCPSCKNLSLKILENGKKECTSCSWSN